ncbi:MAG: hypothetical protein IT287_08330, partial [Bdellovibrionaceae bacterium]|nr:hypothetical protein [Pseudobdellovibrionaceae bacterium]
MAVFTKLAIELNTYVKAEVKATDMKAFQASYAKFYAVIKASAVPVDYANAKAMAEKILLWTPAGDESDSLLTSAKDTATQLVNTLNDIVPEAPEEVETTNYYISDIDYYLTQLQAFSYNNPDLATVASGFKLENSKVALKYLVQSADQLNELLKDIETNKSEIVYAAENLSYAVASNLEEGSFKVFIGANEKIALDFIAQAKGFQGDNNIANVQSIVDYLNQKTEEGNSNAFNTADSVVYSLEQLPALSQNLKNAIAAIKNELTKQQTQYILTTLNTANAELQVATELSQDLYYMIDNLKYSLTESLVVSAAAQVLVKNLAATIANSSSVGEIASYMSAVVTEAKQADHFYFYGGVRRLYKLGENVPTAAANAGANKEAHWFVTQLCGEFRDRATMIEAKLKWVQNMNILPKSDIKVVDPATLAQAKNVWLRITAKAYYPYIQVAAEVWEARRASQERYIQIGNISDIDNPVAGLTVCETKFVFEKYVAQDKSFDDIATYDKNYESYKTGCPTADLTDYYDFRGDSNFKHYSPEANGMIWQATSLARGCSSATKANSGIYTDKDCEEYFKRPFASRYNAARAGLAAWLFRDDKHSDVFSSQGQMVAIYPHKDAALAPFSFGFTETDTAGALFDYNPKWLGVPHA